MKKYDRFKRKDDDEGNIIEYTGLSALDNNPVFKVIRAEDEEFPENSIRIMTPETFKEAYEPLKGHSTHPLISEVNSLLKESPDFQRDLAKALITQFSAASEEEKDSVVMAMLREVLPESLIREPHKR